MKFSRTTKKSECISVKGPKMWNDMPADIKVCKSMFTFKKMYKALLLQPYHNNIIMAGMAIFYVAGYLVDERRRWPVITASPRGQCSK